MIRQPFLTNVRGGCITIISELEVQSGEVKVTLPTQQASSRPVWMAQNPGSKPQTITSDHFVIDWCVLCFPTSSTPAPSSLECNYICRQGHWQGDKVSKVIRIHPPGLTGILVRGDVCEEQLAEADLWPPQKCTCMHIRTHAHTHTEEW